jgi:L-glyceraldehyde 3-phosphate reductase
VSNYPGARFAEATRICQREGYARITIHQPYYNMFGRGIEKDLLPQTEAYGAGVIPFSPLAQGLLTDKYLDGTIPTESRAAQLRGAEWVAKNLSPARHAALHTLAGIAKLRGQSLAQMALAWILRFPAITSALIGASSVRQIEENVAALDNLEFSAEELVQIDAALAQA